MRKEKKGREAVWEESGSVALGHNDRGIQDRHDRERQSNARPMRVMWKVLG
ncbi:MAG: hypothetical protein WCF03_16300 [Nitrososphaeraceae archaeon]